MVEETISIQPNSNNQASHKPQVQPKKDTGFRDFSGCQTFILAAPFFSLWMDFLRLAVLIVVMSVMTQYI